MNQETTQRTGRDVLMEQIRALMKELESDNSIERRRQLMLAVRTLRALEHVHQEETRQLLRSIWHLS